MLFILFPMLYSCTCLSLHINKYTLLLALSLETVLPKPDQRGHIKHFLSKFQCLMGVVCSSVLCSHNFFCLQRFELFDG